MRRWKERFWPTIDDPSSAQRAVDRAARITTIWAVVNLALGVILILSGTTVTERSPIKWQGGVLDSGGKNISGFAFLLCGVLFGLIAWKIRCMSRGWALGGLLLASFILLSDFVSDPSPIALIAHGVVFIYFVNPVRAALAYERLVADQTVLEKLV